MKRPPRQQAGSAEDVMRLKEDQNTRPPRHRGKFPPPDTATEVSSHPGSESVPPCRPPICAVTRVGSSGDRGGVTPWEEQILVRGVKPRLAESRAESGSGRRRRRVWLSHGMESQSQMTTKGGISYHTAHKSGDPSWPMKVSRRRLLT